MSAEIIAKLHSDLLMDLAAVTGVHHQGLRAAAGHLRKCGMPARILKKMVRLDDAFAVSRHITCVSAKVMRHEVAVAASQLQAGSYEDRSLAGFSPGGDSGDDPRPWGSSVHVSDDGGLSGVLDGSSFATSSEPLCGPTSVASRVKQIECRAVLPHCEVSQKLKIKGETLTTVANMETQTCADGANMAVISDVQFADMVRDYAVVLINTGAVSCTSCVIEQFCGQVHHSSCDSGASCLPFHVDRLATCAAQDDRGLVVQPGGCTNPVSPSPSKIGIDEEASAGLASGSLLVDVVEDTKRFQDDDVLGIDPSDVPSVYESDVECGGWSSSRSVDIEGGFDLSEASSSAVLVDCDIGNFGYCESKCEDLCVEASSGSVGCLADDDGMCEAPGFVESIFEYSHDTKVENDMERLLDFQASRLGAFGARFSKPKRQPPLRPGRGRRNAIAAHRKTVINEAPYGDVVLEPEALVEVEPGDVSSSDLCEDCGQPFGGDFFFHLRNGMHHCAMCHASCSCECMLCWAATPRQI
jgi:hypothetical protein